MEETKEETDKKHQSREELDAEICAELKVRERKEMEKELEYIQSTKENKGKAAAIFGIRNKVLGKKNSSDEPSVILHPKTGIPMMKPNEIKEICVDYCKDLLTNKEPKEDFIEDLQWKRRVHEVRMEERLEDEISYSEDMFREAMKSVAKKGGKKYDFILKGGTSLHNALNKLFKVVWEEEKLPDSWRETMIVQIYKGRGLKSDLSNIRHIHTRSQAPKLFSHMVTNFIKPIVVENTSPFQIGAIPGHRSQEHLFTLKSVVALMEENGAAIAIQLLDLVKFFDSESLIDTMNELYRGKVKGKLYRLIYEMNRKSRIKVKTSVGVSEARETEENVTQGSTEAGIISSSNLSKGVEDFFSSSEHEVSYGSLSLLPQSFQDDLCRMCLDPVSSQFGLDRFETLAESKLLSYNLSKSGIVILGSKKARENLLTEFEENPSKLYGENLKVLHQESYLGDQLGESTSVSITLTINKRIGLVKKAIFDIKTIVEDIRSKVTGGIKSGILIWESCIIPFLLNNSSTWINMKKNDIERLNKIQNLFLFTLLNVHHCPIPIMYIDLAVLLIPFLILKEKLILFHHISNLPENAVARNILQIQQRLHLRGLNEEVSQFLTEHEIYDVKQFTKVEWKRLVTNKIKIANREHLIELAKNYKKIDSVSLSIEELEIKDYFSELDLPRARMKFRERANCLKTCKRHYSNDLYNMKTMFLCDSCDSDSVDVTSHWRLCEQYEHLRQNKNLESDLDLMSYYQEVINFRLAAQEDE